MSNQWFRLYHEFATDPKVQMLSEADQRRFIMLLCIKCRNGDVTLQHPLQDDEIAFQLRISADDWKATKANLVTRGMLTEGNEPVAWSKRQYSSDNSLDRVKRHREKVKRSCNGDVTAPDTDTDTERELDKSNSSAIDGTKPPAEPEGFAEFYENAYPRKTGRKAALKAFKTALKETDHASIIAGARRYAEQCHANRTEQQFIKQPATWLNAGCWADEPVHHSTTHRSADRKPNDGDTLLRAASAAASALRA